MHYGCSAPNCSDGGAPTTLVLASDGNFYGAMGTGASSTCYIGCGTIFRLKTDGTYTILYSPVQGETRICGKLLKTRRGEVAERLNAAVC